MNMNIKANVDLHNYFDVEVIREGQVIQTAKAYNLVLDQFYANLILGRNGGSQIQGAMIGTGTGVPSVADTKLFTLKHTLVKDNAATVTYIDNDVIKYVFTVTMPATSVFVGNYTEIGLYGNTETPKQILHTHAMFEDAEGNPITLVKTDIDIMIITCTVYWNCSITGAEGNWVMTPRQSPAVNFCRTTNESSYSAYGEFVFQLWYPLVTACYIAGLDANISGDSGFAAGTFTQDPSNKRRGYMNPTRMIDTAGTNGNYINGIGLGMKYATGRMVYDWQAGVIGYAKLPNADVIPPKVLHELSIGIGDGTKTEFECPLPAFVKNTDVLYANDVALVRGVDYTIDNIHNRQKNISISQGNFIKKLSSPESMIGRPMTSSWFTANYAGTRSLFRFPFYGLGKDSPITLELENDPLVGNKINYIELGIFQNADNSKNTQTASYKFYSNTFIAEYSTDGNTWQEFARSIGTQSNYKVILTRDDAVEASHWRISMELATGALDEVWYPYTNTIMSYVGKPIVFTTPPAAGVVLTMDATVDRPYKYNKTVIDVGMTLEI